MHGDRDRIKGHCEFKFTVNSELRGYKRKPGRPMKNWLNVIKRDLRQMDLTWEEAEELANDKAEWRQRVAQCSRLDAG